MSNFNWILFNIFGKVKYISIVNLIANKKIIPELIQNKMTPQNIMKKIFPYLDIKSNKRQTMLQNLNNLRKVLGSPGVFHRIAKIIYYGKSTN